jgi:hypothetical protein
MEREIIMELAAEGGSITLYKNKRGQFVIDVYDWTYELVDEEPPDCSPIVVDSWEAALSVLDNKYPYWTKLTPRSIDPIFRNVVFAAIQSRPEL